jgi:sarcosine oxidase
VSARFDAIVLGVGGMGSATLYELARRGAKALGLEQFELVHDRGSSHGQTRVIRTAYYEHPCYVPLVRRAFERWYELEQRQGVKLLTECGCLNFGGPQSGVVQGVCQSARQHGLKVEEFQGRDLSHRFPNFRFSDDFVGVLEHQAGFLYVEECVRAHIDAAQRLGAVIHQSEPVHSWSTTANHIEVHTDRGDYLADRLIITAGPWAGRLLAAWGKPLSVMRQTMLWFGTNDDSLFRRDRFPIYLAEVPEGYFYGLPVIDGNGHKVARHYGARELLDPSEVVREVADDDEIGVRSFLSRYLPDVGGRMNRAQVCTYTLTPDRHFILDRHPNHSNVAIAAGFSGHGFKFAPVVGEIMADLAMNGATAWPIDMFQLTRFS